MEYIYPIFEQGRIMKKESLNALRDYSYSGLRLIYHEYCDGIIKGCSLSTNEEYITVGEGIIKCEDFIFLISKPVKIAYVPTEKFISLKFRVEGREEQTDYIGYEADFLLDENLERKENEIEVCRFKIKRGSRLRYEYKNFSDIQTEFDTLNLADATWAGIGGNVLSKAVTDYYAREILKCDGAQMADIQMAYAALMQECALPREVLFHYIQRKSQHMLTIDMTTKEVFYELEKALAYITNGTRGYLKESDKMPRTIMMD